MDNVVLLAVHCNRTKHIQLQRQERVNYTIVDVAVLAPAGVDTSAAISFVVGAFVGGIKGVDTEYQRPAV